MGEGEQREIEGGGRRGANRGREGERGSRDIEKGGERRVEGEQRGERGSMQREGGRGREQRQRVGGGTDGGRGTVCVCL